MEFYSVIHIRSKKVKESADFLSLNNLKHSLRTILITVLSIFSFQQPDFEENEYMYNDLLLDDADLDSGIMNTSLQRYS